jgi:hypothetical protein
MAFGTLAFDTLSVSGAITGTAKSVNADFLATGSAKAFMNFNGTGTAASRKTLNSSSITDNGTGQFRVTIVSAMQDADFVLLGSCIGDGATSNRTGALAASRGSNTTTIMDVNTSTANDDAQADWTHTSIAAFGDLA